MTIRPFAPFSASEHRGGAAQEWGGDEERGGEREAEWREGERQRGTQKDGAKEWERDFEGESEIK